MLESVARSFRKQAGIRDVEDFGVIHRSKVGYAACTVSAAVERWRDTWRLRIETTHSRGRSLRKTRVVKWPYSRVDPTDLGAVMVDLHVVRDGALAGLFADQRTGLGRLFDRMTGRRTSGTYTFRSTIPDEPLIEVTAEIVNASGERTVTLVERTPGSGYVMAHLPHEAFAALSRAIERWGEAG